MKQAWLVIFSVFTLAAVACRHRAPTEAEKESGLYSTKAISAISFKIRDHPRDASLYYSRGVLLDKEHNDTLALKDFEKASQLDSTKAEYFSAAGNLLFEHKDIDASVHWFQQAIKINPQDPASHLKIAKMFLYTRDYPKAFSEINTVLRQNVYNAEAYFLKGMVYKNMGDTAKAISSMQTAVQVSPDYREAVIQLGQLNSARKDPIALKYYDNAFRLDTTDVFPIFAKGVYYQNVDDVADAKTEYVQCIDHDPQYANAFYNLGYLLLQEDSVEKAYRQYDIVTKIEPGEPSAYYNRGLCSEIMNRKDDAIRDYRQAAMLDTAYDEPRKALKRLGVKK